MERFNLKKLNMEEVKESIALRSQISSKLCKIWILMWKLIGLEKLLEEI
jgi:hypothetical protein